MIDFAHNPAGLLGIKEFLATLDAKHHTGIISGTGDRRDDDLREIGRISAGMFDDIIICQEKYLRGRAYDNIVSLIIEGIKEVKPDIPLHIIPNGEQALAYSIENVKPGSFITIIGDSVSNALEAVQAYQDKEAGIYES